MYINSGGDNDVKINGTMYVGDAKSGLGGAATLYRNNDNWGFSSTGDFRDDNDELNAASRYLKQSASMPNQLYATARLSPLSLTYYRYCLENGSYTVRLHFAEIEITNNTRYARLGRRIFNIYIQVIYNNWETSSFRKNLTIECCHLKNSVCPINSTWLACYHVPCFQLCSWDTIWSLLVW